VVRFKPGVNRAHPIEKIELVPSGGGVFDVLADGQLIYSKHETGRHAEISEVLNSIAKLLET